MIHFCTIAYNEKYKNISKLLIESYNKIKNKDTSLHILTGDINYYSQFKNDGINFYQGISHPNNRAFKYNYKIFVLEEVSKIVKNGDFVIFLDCDCVIRKPFTLDNLKWVKNGLNVSLGKTFKEIQTITFNEIQNPTVKEKVKVLNPDETFLYRQFREAFLLFKVDNTFHFFLEESKKLFDELELKKLTHTNICYDIQIIAHRSGMEINDIVAKEVPIRDSIFTLGANGGYCPMIT